MNKSTKPPMNHILAHKDGPALIATLLAFTGALCPKCAYGTRVISKKWSRCKKCGERVERRGLP